MTLTTNRRKRNDRYDRGEREAWKITVVIRSPTVERDTVQIETEKPCTQKDGGRK